MAFDPMHVMCVIGYSELSIRLGANSLAQEEKNKTNTTIDDILTVSYLNLGVNV